MELPFPRKESHIYEEHYFIYYQHSLPNTCFLMILPDAKTVIKQQKSAAKKVTENYYYSSITSDQNNNLWATEIYLQKL